MVSLILSYSLFPGFWGTALEPQQGDKALAVPTVLGPISCFPVTVIKWIDGLRLEMIDLKTSKYQGSPGFHSLC